MEDDFEEMGNLMDDDPALDYILYENMTQEDNKKQSGNGCLGMILLLLLPFVTGIGCFNNWI